jgi:hypothetical protein
VRVVAKVLESTLTVKTSNNGSPGVPSMGTWGSIYMGVKKVTITMFVMSPFNQHILTLHSHEVITVLGHLQIFLILTNHGPKRVIRPDSFIQRRPLETCAALARPLDVSGDLKLG